jgi:hypothetical protein
VRPIAVAAPVATKPRLVNVIVSSARIAGTLDAGFILAKGG